MILAYSDYVASMYPGKRGNMQKTDKFWSIKYGFQFVFADTDFSWKCLLQFRIASLPTVYFTVMSASFWGCLSNSAPHKLPVLYTNDLFALITDIFIY